ncbi:multiple epidermal growth factor-like domains protein 10 isoform X2 [Saccostrea cucullata]|uniref:multiple epidermal growth factor-like domains protein 10 isoform X2 n=1 Tax=Saccostrea cuccullata TaxID=36930 RepID=UPI002ECFECDB
MSSCTETDVIGGSASDKRMWWQVDLGDTYSIKSINIAFKSFGDKYVERDRGRVAGFSLFLSNSKSKENGWMCYKDGPELPPLNFSTDCIGHGRYVIYYNERMDGETYPDGYETISFNFLCEVIVKGCQEKGVYGSDCNTPCPENCQYQRCYIVNGSCLECKSGWTGHMCARRCFEGWFGLGCTNKCVGHCINNDNCNHISGICDGGCAPGWTGPMCDKECENGMYGINCVHNCSGNCYNNSNCNKISGHCDTGCGPGYFGTLCEKSCAPGRFGNLCKETCSGHCVNNMTCNHVDGVCTQGCNDGYIEAMCNKPCEVGYFGSLCSRKCSVNCINTFVCKNTDGACRCAPGWTGSPICNIECSQAYGENCQLPCSENCVNRTCDRFNGSCLTECMGGTFGEKCDQWRVESSGDSGPPLTSVVIVGVLTVFIIFAVVVIFSIRRKIVRNFKTSKKCSENNGTENIEVVSEYVNEYQELSSSRDNNEYQSIRMSEVTSVEQSNTYQNLVLTTV